jgi:hypothetical protein
MRSWEAETRSACGTWRMDAHLHAWYPRVDGTKVSADPGPARAEVKVSRAEGPFRLTPNGYFMEARGPAWSSTKRGCQKKLCFVATDRLLLADVLRELAERPDCVYVKYSAYPRDGMFLGRCFLSDEHEVGLLWAKYKEHRHLFCSIQDDDFTAPFRPSW